MVIIEKIYNLICTGMTKIEKVSITVIVVQRLTSNHKIAGSFPKCHWAKQWTLFTMFENKGTHWKLLGYYYLFANKISFAIKIWLFFEKLTLWCSISGKNNSLQLIAHFKPNRLCCAASWNANFKYRSILHACVLKPSQNVLWHMMLKFLWQRQKKICASYCFRVILKVCSFMAVQHRAHWQTLMHTLSRFIAGSWNTEDAPPTLHEATPPPSATVSPAQEVTSVAVSLVC